MAPELVAALKKAAASAWDSSATSANLQKLEDAVDKGVAKAKPYVVAAVIANRLAIPVGVLVPPLGSILTS